MATAGVSGGEESASSSKVSESFTTGYLKELILRKYDGELPTKFLCSECDLVLRDPVQSACGHRFCKLCLERVLRSPVPSCRSCEADTGEGTMDEFGREHSGFPDRAILREMKVLVVTCPSEGCPWSGMFKFYPKHEAECEHRQVICDKCKERVIAKDLSKHLDPNIGSCMIVRQCPFGCNNGLNTKEHFSQNSTGHLNQLLEMVKQLQATHAQNSPNDNSRFNTDLAAKVERIDSQVNELRSTCDDFVKQGAVVKTPGGLSEGGLQEINVKCATVEGVTAVLNREIERIITDMSAYEHQSRLQQAAIDTLQGKVAALERSAALRDIDSAEKQLRIDTLESTTYDGEYLWRITDFARKRQEAVDGRTPSIYSPPFYTSRSGYKVCARLYLNGDGAGRGSHISLFFVVMRGDYDLALVWPFPHKVVFSLLNLDGGDNISDGFRPDPSSSSFRRPVSSMNIASGMPLFCPISKLEARNSHFVKEDTLFIRIKVLCNA